MNRLNARLAIIFMIASFAIVLPCTSRAQSHEMKSPEQTMEEESTSAVREEAARTRNTVRDAHKKTESKTAARLKESEQAIKESLESSADRTASSVSDAVRSGSEAVQRAAAAEAVWTRKSLSIAALAVILIVIVLDRNMHRSIKMVYATMSGSGNFRQADPMQDPALLTDPDIPALEKYSEKNHGVTQIPIRITVEESSTSVTAIAELREGKSLPLVWFSDEPMPARWVDRKKRAARHAASKNRSN